MSALPCSDMCAYCFKKVIHAPEKYIKYSTFDIPPRGTTLRCIVCHSFKSWGVYLPYHDIAVCEECVEGARKFKEIKSIANGEFNVEYEDSSGKILGEGLDN